MIAAYESNEKNNKPVKLPINDEKIKKKLTNNMIKVGVIGYGKMGKLHSKVFKKLRCEIYATTNRSQKIIVAHKDGVNLTLIIIK